MVKIVVMACVVALAWFAVLIAALYAIVQVEGQMSKPAVTRFRTAVLLGLVLMHAMMLVAFAVWGKEQAFLILC